MPTDTSEKGFDNAIFQHRTIKRQDFILLSRSVDIFYKYPCAALKVSR
jgi:hypothetical protein